jgi:phage-related minor tail protein
MDNTLDPLWIVLGGIASIVVTALKRLLPAFGRWFDALSEEDKQSLMLWIGIAVVAAVTVARLWGTSLPTDPAALVQLLISAVAGVLQQWAGQAGVFGATKHIFSSEKTTAVAKDDGAVG